VARVAGHRRRPTGAPSAPAPDPGAGALGRPPTDAPPSSPADADLLVVGRVGKPQGIKGEVTVQVRTDDPDARFAPGAVLLTEPAARGPLVVAASRWQNGRLVVAFEGVPDRTAAELLRETLLQVDARTLPPPQDEDEFHDHVLRGMAAVLVGGATTAPGQRADEPFARVTDVLHLPHGDVLVLARADTGAEVLVPFVRAMVPVVDVAARVLHVDPPEGLLDLTADPDPDPDAP
jgi:16S rRNA processing protein RimM